MTLRVLVLALTLGSGAATGAPARAVTVSIVIDQVAFRDTSIAAHVGDTIEWINHDVVDHTATAKHGEFDVALPAGKKGRVVMKEVGVFEYYCRLHPNMVGKITVEKRK